MTTDSMKRVKFNPGEHVRAEDFNDLQKQVHMMISDTLIRPLMGNYAQRPDNPLTYHYDPEHNYAGMGGVINVADMTDMCFAPFPASGIWAGNGVARTLEILTPGPFVQVLRTQSINEEPDPDDPCIAVYWGRLNTGALVTAVGHATLPRIDVVEMKLEIVDDAAETRVTSTAAVRATLDLDPLTANCDTEIQAKNPGAYGNDLSIAFVADGAGIGSLTNSGNALTFHFATGVTTVANFETAVAASGLISILNAGTGANILVTPGDVFGTTSFAGGSDSVIIGSSVVKSYRVNATFQIKQGTPNANPTFPTLTAGYAPVIGAYIDPLMNSAHTDNLIDMRWPLGGIRYYDVMHNDLIPETPTDWADDAIGFRKNKITVNNTYLNAVCPVGGALGRIMAVGVHCRFDSVGAGNNESGLWCAELNGSDPPTLNQVCNLNLNTNADNIEYTSAIRLMDRIATLESEWTRAANSRVGAPVWVDGTMNGPYDHTGTDTDTHSTVKKAVVRLKGANTSWFSMVRFIVAHGMT